MVSGVVVVMGQYWQPCIHTTQCRVADPRLECVERGDGGAGRWCDCREGSDLVEGSCVDIPSPVWTLLQRLVW